MTNDICAVEITIFCKQSEAERKSSQNTTSDMLFLGVDLLPRVSTHEGKLFFRRM